MKKFCKEYLDVNPYGQVGDKVLLGRGVATLVTVLLCLVAMVFTAYAYFTADVSSSGNVIQAATFDVALTVEGEDGSQPAVIKDGKVYKVTLQPNIPYTVTVNRGGNADTGFCEVKTSEGTYHTQQLGADWSASVQPVNSISFLLTVAQEETVTFRPHWGTSVHYSAYTRGNAAERYIEDEDEIVIGTLNSASDEENTETPGTEPTTPTEDQQTGATEPVQGDQTPTEPTTTPTEPTAPTEPAQPTEPVQEEQEAPTGDAVQEQGGEAPAEDAVQEQDGEQPQGETTEPEATQAAETE